mgnify:CR=1 FL=1
MVKLIVIRHAESEMNKLGIHQGQIHNTGLSSEGIKQAKALAEFLKSEKISEIYSSDMKRAFETASIISQSLGNVKIKKDKRLREFTMGDFDNFPEKRDVLFKEFYAKEFAKGKSKYDIRPPNGENIWDLIKRVKEFMEEIKDKENTIVAVTHGGTNEVLLNLAQDLEKDSFKRYHQENTCINELSYENNKWKIIFINKTPHLEKIEKIKKEIYNDQEQIKKEILEKVTKILSENKIPEAYLFGSLLDKKFGEYLRQYGRHRGSNVNILAYMDTKNIPREWKYIDREEGLWEIYEIGKFKVNEIKHRIDIFILKDKQKIKEKINELNLKVEKII